MWQEDKKIQLIQQCKKLKTINLEYEVKGASNILKKLDYL